MRKLLSMIVVLYLFVIGQVFAQDRTVSGKVTSKDDGTPLPGVTVMVKGTTLGTTTDVEGTYKLAVPATAKILVFSFVGMQTKEEEIGARSAIDVALSSGDQVLNEVVVTAIGVERQKRELTYATQNVAGGQLAQKSEPNVINALQGKLAGVEIIGASGMAGSRSQIFIRGLSSATQNNQPLFVIDGVPIDNSSLTSSGTLVGGAAYSNRALDIDPNDIEAMTVLKGPAAAALYGARAANGAIMITMKKGKNTNKKMEITVTSSYNIQEVNTRSLPVYQNQYGQGQFGRFNPGVLDSWGPRFGTPGMPAFVPDFTVDSVRYQAYPDNYKAMFRTGTMMDNGIALAGGSDKTKYRLSFNRTSQTGIIANSSLDRYNFRVAGSTELGNGFGVDASLTYTQTEQGGVQQGNTGLSPWFVLPFIPRSYDLAGTPYRGNIVGVQRNSLFTLNNRDNPRWAADENLYQSNVDRVIVSASVNYKPTFIKGLSATYRLGIDQYSDKRMEVAAFGSRPSNSNWATAGTNGAIYFDNYLVRNFNHDLFAIYNKDIGTDISLRFMAGTQITNNIRLNDGAIGNSMNVPRFYNLANFTAQNTQTFNNILQRRLIGVYATASASYKNWLTLELQARNDWFSTLPTESNNILYPSISGSFVFTDAFGIKDNPIISYGKLRANYAAAGNDIDPYLYNTVYPTASYGNNVAGVNFPFLASIPGYTLSNRQGAAETGLGLRPELKRSFEIGGELVFWKGKISVDATYFYVSQIDQLFANLPTAAAYGFTSRTANSGEITNRGVEAAIDAKIIENKNGFNWSANLNYTLIRNKVESLGVNQIVLSGFTTFGAGVVPGQPFGVFIGSDFVRGKNGEVLINPLTGYPQQTNSDKVIGDPNPNYSLGFSNNFSYKGLSLNVVLQYVDGGAVISRQTQIARVRGVLEETADRERPFMFQGVFGNSAGQYVNAAGQPLGDGATPVPNNIQHTAFDYYVTSGLGSTVGRYAVFDATVLRLREISISYELPKKWLDKTPFGSASIGVSGRNLWFHAPNLPHADPENNQQGGNSRGFEFNAPPSARQYGANIRFTF